MLRVNRFPEFLIAGPKRIEADRDGDAKKCSRMSRE